MGCRKHACFLVLPNPLVPRTGPATNTMLEQLSYTCHSAFEVLGQHEAVVLRQQNEALRVELFNTAMPSFATVVRSFNDSLAGPQCTCPNCQHMGLIQNNWHEDWQGPCVLWPAWETLLARLHIDIDPQLDIELAVLVPWCDFNSLAVECPGIREHMELTSFFANTGDTPCLNRCGTTHAWEDFTHIHSSAAVKQWNGRWTQGMEVVGSWGPPARSLGDDRVAAWTRLLAAVRDMHYPARTTPTLGEYLPAD